MRTPKVVGEPLPVVGLATRWTVNFASGRVKTGIPESALADFVAVGTMRRSR